MAVPEPNIRVDSKPTITQACTRIQPYLSLAVRTASTVRTVTSRTHTFFYTLAYTGSVPQMPHHSPIAMAPRSFLGRVLPPAANLVTAPRGVDFDFCPPVLEYISVSSTRMLTSSPAGV